MILASIMSGLGNQLFQYANARALAYRLGVDCCLDLRWFEDQNLFCDGNAAKRMYLLNKFNINATSWDKPFSLEKSNLIKFSKNMPSENEFFFDYYGDIKQFDKNFLNQKDRTYISCASQSYKNFIDFEDNIKNDLRLIVKPSGEDLVFEKLIQSCNSVSIHIRRGDKANNPEVKKIHGECSINYYNRAIETLKEKFEDFECFVFSDDIEWVERNFKINNKVHYVNHNKKEEDSVRDLRLMSLCNHHIMANSSFSWWGSWLGKSSGITIAPDFWAISMDFNLEDLYPPNWIILEDKCVK